MFTEIKNESLLDLSKTIAKDIFEGTTYPWEVLEKLPSFIIELGSRLPEDEYEKTGENIWIAKSAVVAPSASITGPLIICPGAEIRHCAFIRGNAIIGENAVVGNSTEVKGSILFNNVQTPHYNYIGDSILGYKAHTGAGTITSNLKSDKTNITVLINNQRVETGRKKFGAVVGDRVEVGCNAVLNPGTIIGRDSSVYPLSMVRGFVPENSIFKNTDDVVQKSGK